MTVAYATSNGTAVEPGDYTALSATLTFAPGDTTRTIAVALAGDSGVEPDETFTVVLSAPTNAAIGRATGVGTITNDDTSAAPAITALTAGATGPATATVTWSTNEPATTQVDYGIGAAGQSTPLDAALVTAHAVSLTGLQPGATYLIVARSQNGSSVLATSSPITLTLPALPVLTISDVTVAEGTGTGGTATFTVTLAPSSTQPVTVAYATSNGTAVAPGDFAAASGTLTFPPGTTSLPITVAIVGDSDVEPNESFTVALSNQVNATIGDGTGLATVTNDDVVVPQVSVNDVTVAEGNAGTTTATFTVTLSAATTQSVSVAVATADGTATGGSDFTAASGTLTFAPGTTTQAVIVNVFGDTLVEATETFAIVLSSPANATIANGSGLGTISNDDATPTLSIGNATVTEGNAGATVASFTVSASAASAWPVSVAYASGGATATAGVDFTATSGTLTIPAGVTTGTITVPVLGDVLDEVNETFAVVLSSPVNATIAAPTGVATIADDDAAPTLAISDVSVAEGNAGTTGATFAVTLSAVSGQTVAVAYATANGTASAGSDFTATSGTLTFAAGVTAQTISVPVLGDLVAEPNETFTVLLTGPANASIGDGSGLGTVTNDDISTGPVSVTITVPMANGGDDVNEDGASFNATGSTIWMGTASVASASYAGLRFANVTIPAGATITSATIDVRASSTQWQPMAFQIAVEAAVNSPAFTATSRPSQRVLLPARVSHSSNVKWTSGTRYQLDQIAALLQAAVAQPGWTPGSAVSFVLRGTGNAWGRKFASAFESGAANAPRLLVTYTTP